LGRGGRNSSERGMEGGWEGGTAGEREEEVTKKHFLLLLI